MPIGVQIPTRADIITNSTSIKSAFADGKVTLTITVTIDKAQLVDAEPTDPRYSYLKYVSGTDIETTSKSADYAYLRLENNKLRLSINMGISGKIGGAGVDESILNEVRELRKVLDEKKRGNENTDQQDHSNT